MPVSRGASFEGGDRRTAVGLSRYRSLEDGVEAAQALESAGEGDAGYRQGRVHEEPLGEQQAVRLRELHRGHAELPLQGPSEMTLADAQLAGELGHAPAIERARADAVCRHSRQPRHGVDQRPAGRQLGPAAEAGAESVPLGGRGGVEETPAIGVGHSRGTHRPAVDPRRGDADEEHPVEAGVACIQRASADVGTEDEVWGGQAGHADQSTARGPGD